MISFAVALGVIMLVPAAPQVPWDATTSARGFVFLLLEFICVLTSQAIIFTYGIRIGLFWFLSRPREPFVHPKIPRLATLHYALPCMAVWSLYHLALWPAIMNADVGDQWEQIHSLQFDDWHPAFLSFTYWLVSKFCDSPAAVVELQIVALACAFGWGLVLLRQAGLGSRPAWGIAAILALSPMNAIWVNCIAKDTPFSIVMAWLTLFLFEAVITRGDSLGRLDRLLCLLFLLPPAMLFRHNGLAPSALSLAFLICLYRRHAMRIGAVALISLAIFGGVKLWLYPSLKVAPTMIRMNAVIHLVAAHVDAGTPLTAEERKTLSGVHRLEDHWSYDPYRLESTLFGPTFGFSKFTVYPSDLPWIAWRMTLRNPEVTLRHFYHSSMFAWRIKEPEGGSQYSQYYILWDDKANDGSSLRYMDSLHPLMEEPILPSLTYWIWYMFRAMRHFSFIRALWSPALRTYLFSTCVFLWCAREKDWRGLLILVPAISNEAAIAFGAGGVLAFRYHLPVHFVAYLFLGLLFIRRGSARPQSNHSTSNSPQSDGVNSASLGTSAVMPVALLDQ